MTPDRSEGWPHVFTVPTFSYEVELIHGEGHVAYERTGKAVKLSSGQKHDILETLAGRMHSFKAYPNDKEVSMVAEALVTKHPCLKEPGSQTGWYGWKNSLKFKLGNYHSKLSRAGFQEVAVNSGKRSRNNPDKQAPHTNIKRPKRAEVNFLSNFPQGENTRSLEQLRLEIVDEVKKSDKNLVLITKLMHTTFALRRKEVITEDLPVGDILERWPALKIESQVKQNMFPSLHLFEQIYYLFVSVGELHGYRNPSIGRADCAVEFLSDNFVNFTWFTSYKLG